MNIINLCISTEAPFPHYGTQQPHMQHGKRNSPVTVIIADVQRLILCADDLQCRKLIVDLWRKKLIDAHSFQLYPCVVTTSMCTQLSRQIQTTTNNVC